jgi:hypothetical protein
VAIPITERRSSRLSSSRRRTLTGELGVAVGTSSP